MITSSSGRVTTAVPPAILEAATLIDTLHSDTVSSYTILLIPAQDFLMDCRSL